ncbi:MAG: hypothetical protein ACR2OX_09675, partial [Methyloligellaceae bacterium]
PESKVRHISQPALNELWIQKGHYQHIESSEVYGFEVPKQVGCTYLRSFKSTSLACLAQMRFTKIRHRKTIGEIWLLPHLARKGHLSML